MKVKPKFRFIVPDFLDSAESFVYSDIFDIRKPKQQYISDE